MGLLDTGSIGRYHDALGGRTGKKAAQAAAYVQLQALDKAEGLASEQYPAFADYYRPRAEMGETAFGEYAAGRTPEGFAANLDAISSGGAYDAILKPRMAASQRQLSSSGLSRSSFGAGQAADVSQDTLLGIEGLLSGRQRDVSQMGYDALGQQVGFEQTFADLMQNYALQRGQVQAGGILGKAEAGIQGEANRQKVMDDVGQGIMDMFGSMFSMGGGGSGGGGAPVSGGGLSSGLNVNQYGGYA